MKVFSMEKALESITKGSKDEEERGFAQFVLEMQGLHDGMSEQEARATMKGIPNEVFEEREEK